MSRIEGSPPPASPVATAAALRAVSAQDGRGAQATGAKADKASPASPVVLSEAVAAGAAPVDADRVTEIRKAIESGTYPLLPTKIADAMIAAGMLWRSPK